MRAGFVARTAQTQTVSTTVVQEARFLQAAGPELEALVADAIAANPLIERLDEPVGYGSGAADGATDAENVWDDLDAPGFALDPDAGGGDASDGAAVFDQSLAAHLTAQLALARLDFIEHAVAEYLIDALEPSGYFTGSVEDAAVWLGVDAAMVERVLARLRGFDPTGVFAKDLADCLALQLQERGRMDGPMRSILFRLEALAAGRVEEIRRRAGLDPQAFQERLTLLRSLDPAPGRRFGADADPVGAPELLIERQSDGAWAATLNPEAFPRLRPSRDTYERYLRRAQDTDRRYLRDQWGSARLIQRALSMRARMLRRLGAFIVSRQQSFFDQGVAELKPLLQQEAAEALEVDPSAVSRAVAGKRLSCPRGVFELKFFFPGRAAEGEAAASATSVQARIAELVAQEDPTAPLSDDALVEILTGEGVAIARRTVAKYREAAGIEGSRRRKRLHAAKS